MARALIVGCGCRGRELAGRLRSREWLVRGTSRTPEGLAAIESAGVEPAEADPDRPGTILDLCADVSVVVWLLGSADGEPDAVSDVNGPRLERLLEKLVETPVRGFAYEAEGTAGAGPLRSGREIVERAGETWRIPITLLTLSREESGWADRTAEQVAGLLAG
jgi:uncharacterized protein YbjT (DUF2867 family)